MAMITVAVEGIVDVPIVRTLFTWLGHEIAHVHGLNGKNKVDTSLKGYNKAAQFAPWFVLRDFDHDAACAAALVRMLLPVPAKQMVFRVAVREAEAWLLADPERISGFLSVPRSAVPTNPDSLGDPKASLVSIARKSKRKAVREGIVPLAGTTADVGPEYVSQISDFASNHWRPEVAAHNSDSLNRCIARLKAVTSP